MTGLLLTIILNQIRPGHWLANTWWAAILTLPVTIAIITGEQIGAHLMELLWPTN